MSDSDLVVVEDAPEVELGPIGKMRNSCWTMCAGMFIFPLCLFLLGWNEKNFVCRRAQIFYAEAEATEIPSSVCSQAVADTPWNDYADQFTYFSCDVPEAEQQLWKPTDFNVNGNGMDVIEFNSPVASQHIQMYQCIETKTEYYTGSGENRQKVTEYSHELGWSSNQETLEMTPENNDCGSAFSGTNPTFPTSAMSKVADDAQVGPFKVTDSLVSQFSANTAVDLTSWSSSFTGTQPSFPYQPQLKSDELKVEGSLLVSCPDTDGVGCIKLYYQKSSAQQASVLGKMSSTGTVVPQETPASWGCGEDEMAELFTEDLTFGEMIEKLRTGNEAQLWLLRLVGCLGAWAAVYCCFAPIAAGADVVGDFLDNIPCIGDALERFVEGVVTAILCVLSCGIGCSCAFFVIAIVWVVMRPLVGGIMLAVAVVLMVAVVVVRHYYQVPEGAKRRRKKADAEENAEAEEA